MRCRLIPIPNLSFLNHLDQSIWKEEVGEDLKQLTFTKNSNFIAYIPLRPGPDSLFHSLICYPPTPHTADMPHLEPRIYVQKISPYDFANAAAFLKNPDLIHPSLSSPQHLGHPGSPSLPGQLLLQDSTQGSLPRNLPTQGMLLCSFFMYMRPLKCPFPGPLQYFLCSRYLRNVQFC